MILAIPIGYFVAILLVISGFMSGMDYLAARPENCTRTVLLHGLVEAAWPLVAGTVVLLLIQINKQLENLRLAADYTPATQDTKKKKKKKPLVDDDDDEDDYRPVVPKAAKPATVTPAVTPLVPNLAGLTAPRQTPVTPQPPTPQPVPPSSIAGPQVPMYPNSPIPGGGRVPQQPAQQQLPPQQPMSVPPTRTGKRAPVAPKADNQQGLSFFKVD